MIPSLLAYFAALALVAFMFASYTRHVGPVLGYTYHQYTSVGISFGTVLGLSMLVSYFTPPYETALNITILVMFACVIGIYRSKPPLQNFLKHTFDVFGMLVPGLLLSDSMTSAAAFKYEPYLLLVLVAMSTVILFRRSIERPTLGIPAA